MNIENSGILSSHIASHVPAVPSSTEDDERHQEHFKTDHLLPNLKTAHHLERRGYYISSGGEVSAESGLHDDSCATAHPA